MRPCVPKQVVREYTYVYAAVAPERGLMTSLLLPSANTAMMNLFLEYVSQTFAQYFIVMQVDQAAWHRSKALVIASEHSSDRTARLQPRSQSGGTHRRFSLILE